MIGPLLAIGGGLGGLGLTYFYLKRWADAKREPVDPPGPAPGPSPSPITDDEAKPDGGGGQKKQGATCSRTGEKYDAGRWSSPMHVAAGLIALGYPVGPTLLSPDDVKNIRKFQVDATALNLRGMIGAGSKWHKGDMGACTLLAMSNAEALLKSGKWIPRTPKNWFEKNWVTHMKTLLEGS